MQWAPPLMSSWPTAPQALPLAPALNQQKRRSDEMDQSSLKRVRYVPPPGNEPPLHTIFSQQIARTNTDEATDVEIDDAPSARQANPRVRHACLPAVLRAPLLQAKHELLGCRHNDDGLEGLERKYAAMEYVCAFAGRAGRDA